MNPAALLSPTSGRPLRHDTPHSLAVGAERWPVVDAIPFLRTGRERLAEQALERLDAGDRASALVLLLADQDDWWTGPPADASRIRTLVGEADRLTLRDAMDHLGFGRVGDYFAHRWSDPTFMAGLALVEAHWNAPRSAFELGCGIGHNLRELARRGVEVSGGDVVFAKLWLARHWVLGPPARLVCFDAAAPWPVSGFGADLVLCHDALYFLEPKPAILARLRDVAGEGGWLAVAHVHNRESPGFSAGAAMLAEEVDALFPDAIVYDDAELTRALVEARAPEPKPASALREVDAFSIAAGPGLRREPAPLRRGLALPVDGASLRRNPLYAPAPDGAFEIAWPSARYAEEYGPRVTYPSRSHCPEWASSGPAVEILARRRELVDLPERW